MVITRSKRKLYDEEEVFTEESSNESGSGSGRGDKLSQFIDKLENELKNHNHNHSRQQKENDTQHRKKILKTIFKEFENQLEEFYGTDEDEFRMECDRIENWRNLSEDVVCKMSEELRKINQITKDKQTGLVKLLNTTGLTIEKKQEISETISGLSELEPCSQEYKNLATEIYNSIKEQTMTDRDKYSDELKPYYDKIQGLMGGEELKTDMIRHLNILKELSDTEYAKKKEWLETVLAVPFGKYVVQDEDYKTIITRARDCLDKHISYLEEAKDEVLSFILKFLQTPPESHEPIALAIHGSPGVGKTSLVREGISRALNRPFHTIALGGAKDSTILLGNNYTYTGSICGKIVDILKKSKVMNPIIYFDELDKISGTPEGQEIISVLTHIIDPSQNSTFHDNYIGDIDIDLSKVVFIFSYNYSSSLDSILADRINKIHIKNPTNTHKKEICRRHVIPKLMRNKNFTVDFNDGALSYLLSLTNEKGCREINRHLDYIISRVNMLFNGFGDYIKLDYKNVKLEIADNNVVVIDADSARDLIREKIKNSEFNCSSASMMSMYS